MFSIAILVALSSLVQATDLSPGSLVHFPLGISQKALANAHQKRQAGATLASQLADLVYTIDVTLGTPGQKVPVQFDTGSSELWVNPTCSRANNPAACSSRPRFTSSLTLVDLGVTGDITHPSGYAEFVYVMDRVSIGATGISQQIFGAAYTSSGHNVGVLGAGPSLSSWDSPYPFIIDNLFFDGSIRARCFSLDMRGPENIQGSVLYGGVDTGKFYGKLEKLPIVPAAASPDGLTRFWIELGDITIEESGKEPAKIATNRQAVLVDSGSLLSALPVSIVQRILGRFPSASPIAGTNMYQVGCALRDSDGTVDFTFGGTDIKIPFGDFILSQNNICILGVTEVVDIPRLGSTFLRAAYVVFDWDNRNIYVANKNKEDCGSNLVVIEAGPDFASGLTGDCPPPAAATSSAAASSTEASSAVFSSAVSSSAVSSSAVSSSAVTSSAVSSSIMSIDTSDTSTSDVAAASSTDPSGAISSVITSSDVISASSSISSILSSSQIISLSVSASEVSASQSSVSEPSFSASSSQVVSAIASSTTVLSKSAPESVISATSGSESSAASSESIEPSAISQVSSTSIRSSSEEATLSVSATSSDAFSMISSSSCSDDISATVTEEPSAEPTSAITTSIITTTQIYTITSCAPTVADCSVGSITTETVTTYTTYCPEIETGSSAQLPGMSLSASFSAPASSTSTDQNPTRPASVYPQTTNTYVVQQTKPCEGSCPSGSIITEDHTLIVPPITEKTKPTPVPSMNPHTDHGAHGPSTTSFGHHFTSLNETVTTIVSTACVSCSNHGQPAASESVVVTAGAIPSRSPICFTIICLLIAAASDVL